MKKTFSFGQLSEMKERVYGYGRKPGLTMNQQRELIAACEYAMRKNIKARQALKLVGYIATEE